jgi:tRNA1(Val) A37 N6-methylase TrmN6
MIAAARMHGFAASRITEVHSTGESGPKRTLLEFMHRTGTLEKAAETATLVIQDAGPGTCSEEYRVLTRDFYLYF